MNNSVLRALGASAFAVLAPISFPVAGQSCDCSHQGVSVSCPAGLPAGSRSVQFVNGGTNWQTPDGRNVFVPQTNFSCHASPSSTSTQRQEPTSSDHHHGGKDNSQLLIGLLGHELDHQQHHASTSLKEDPALVCYRHVSATVVDGRGGIHRASLYDQLVQASGALSAQLAPKGSCATCSAPSYDCGGTFYDGDGKSVRFPPFRAENKNEADLKRWKDSVSSFFFNAYTDPNGRRLPPGKAAVCSAWAQVSSQTRPDPSALQALSSLQQIGGEQLTGQDTTWLTHIADAGTEHGCSVPAPLTGHDMDSWVVPAQSAHDFLHDFRDCSSDDPNRVGGCPHAFDPGNHVNAEYLLDFKATQGGSASVFVGDSTGGCGMDCYRPAGHSTSSSESKDADTQCIAAINACLDACQASNAALSTRCIETGGTPTGAICAADVDKCSCTQSAPVCKLKP